MDGPVIDQSRKSQFSRTPYIGSNTSKLPGTPHIHPISRTGMGRPECARARPPHRAHPDPTNIPTISTSGQNPSNLPLHSTSSSRRSVLLQLLSNDLRHPPRLPALDLTPGTLNPSTGTTSQFGHDEELVARLALRHFVEESTQAPWIVSPRRVSVASTQATLVGLRR